MNATQTSRRSAVEGMFYPAEPAVLRRDIAGLLRRVERKGVKGKIRGIVAPHAGYPYSGYTAAHGYAMLQGARYDTVVIVSPSHQEYFDGVSVYAGQGYSTPLGMVPVDDKLRDNLLRVCHCAEASEAGHRDEHAVEVQLPFLQEVVGSFKLLPIVIGDQRRLYCFELGEALGSILAKEDYLLVASTDLSHFHSAPIADMLDSIVVEDVSRFDYEKLMTDLETGKTEACGGGPTVAVMVALHRLGITSMKVLHHCNSGETTGDYARVVGYLSAIAYV
jgi:MEMO1 family protein